MWTGCQLLESAAGVSGIPVPVTGMGGGLSPSATVGEWCVSQKQLLGVRDMSEELSTSGVGQCAGFAWSGFGSGAGEAAGLFSVKSCQNLPPCPEEPMPDSWLQE